MIAQNQAAIPLLQAIGRRGFRREPVIGRIIVAQLERRRLRIEPDQPAIAAFDDLENLAGGVIQAIGGGKQGSRSGVAAGRAFAGV
ncbi:MAG TPA: hypothetical protein VMB85_06335 [Bryobacteraceae bacterium]|nr:hypothetical protein [Bryobacteraceae bacterium]